MTESPASASAVPQRRLETGDFWGGLAAMLVALPSAVAYGVTSYAAFGGTCAAQGALAGVLGTIALGLTASWVGGTPRLISAPCAPAAAVMSALAATLVGEAAGSAGGMTPAQALPLMALTALVAGVLQLCFGALGGGRIIKYIPYPVVSGYLCGVAVLILVSQLPKLLGLPHGTSSWLGVVTPSLWNGPGLLVGLATMACMLLAPKVSRKLPGPILGVAGGIAAYWLLAALQPALRVLDGNPLVIGPLGGKGSLLAGLASHWESLASVRLADLQAILVPALTLSVLLSIDTLKTGVVVDALTRSRHDSNRELRGQGVGNLVSAFLGGMPGSGTMGPTLVNLNSGGRTRLSGTIEGASALVAFLALGGALAWVPIPALAGILMVVAFRMFDWSSVQLLRQKSTLLDFCVIAAVVVVAVGYHLIAATAVGFGLAILLFIREQMRGSVIRRKLHGHEISSRQHRLPEQREALDRAGSLTTVCELQGSLFFGTTDRLFTELDPDLKQSRYLVLDMRRVQSVDFTAAHMLQQMEAILRDRGAFLIFSDVPASSPTGRNLEAYLRQMGLVGSASNVQLFVTLDQALEWVEDRVLAEAGLIEAGQERPLELAQFELLRELEGPSLEALGACVSPAAFQTGDFVFRHGDAGDEIYLIRRGMVRIELPLENNRQLTITTFCRGSFFGDMAFLAPGARSADAIALAPTDLFVIRRSSFNQVVMEHPLLGVKVFARLARTLALRLRRTDSELRALQES